MPRVKKSSGKNKRVVIPLFLISLAAVLTVFLSFRQTVRPPAEHPTDVHPMDAGRYTSAMSAAEKNRVPCTRFPVAAIIPHYPPGYALAAGALAFLSCAKPATVVLLSPDHSDTLNRPVTARMTWKTYSGSVISDDGKIRSLIATGLADDNPDMVRSEHGLNEVIGFIAAFLPNARVVPIIIPNRSVLETDEGIARTLGELSDPRPTAYIVSADFSHYLRQRAADANDEETIGAIRSHDIAAVKRMGPDKLDAPGAVVVLLSLLNAGGKTESSLIGRGNAAQSGYASDAYTTGYAALVFW